MRDHRPGRNAPAGSQHEGKPLVPPHDEYLSLFCSKYETVKGKIRLAYRTGERTPSREGRPVMNHDTLKNVIFDQHEVIRAARIVPRRYTLDPKANYVITGLRRAGRHPSAGHRHQGGAGDDRCRRHVHRGDPRVEVPAPACRARSLGYRYALRPSRHVSVLDADVRAPCASTAPGGRHRPLTAG